MILPAIRSQYGTDLNKADAAFISALQADGRASCASLARRLKVGESTVRRRMRRLLQQQTILATALVGPFKVGQGHCTLIGLDVDLQRLDSVWNSRHNGSPMVRGWVPH